VTNILLAIQHLRKQMEAEPPFSVRRAELRRLVNDLETLARAYRGSRAA
jgi:hypothetical protein